MRIPSSPLPLYHCDYDAMACVQRKARSVQLRQQVSANAIPLADATQLGSRDHPLQKDLLRKLARKNDYDGSVALAAPYPINTALRQADRARNADERALLKAFARFRRLPEKERKAELSRWFASRWQTDNDGSEEIAYLLPNMESFEVKLARQLFHDPAAFQAVDAAIVRLREVLIALNPDAPLETIEKTFFNDSTVAANVGVGVTTLDKLRQHGNLRMLLVAFLNAAFRWENKFDLCQSLSRIARTPNWRTRIENAGLDVERIAIARERLLASGNFDMTSLHIYFHPEAYRILPEFYEMRRGRKDRSEEDAVCLRWTYGDYERHGMPVHPLEYLHLIRKSNDTITLTDRDGKVYEINPMSWAPLPPGAHGPEFPLNWGAGKDQRDVDLDTRWGEVMRKRKHPVIAGPSGSTAIFLTTLKWLNVSEISDAHFLRAVFTHMRLPDGHSLYEFLRGAQMANPHLFHGNDKLQLFGDEPNSLGASQELFDEVAAQVETNPAAAKVIAEAHRPM